MSDDTGVFSYKQKIVIMPPLLFVHLPLSLMILLMIPVALACTHPVLCECGKEGLTAHSITVAPPIYYGPSNQSYIQRTLPTTLVEIAIVLIIIIYREIRTSHQRTTSK